MHFDEWRLTPQRAAIHLPTATAVIADVHLGYSEARRRSGDAVPLSSLDEITAALRAIQRPHGVRRLVIAGDLFERANCDESLTDWLAWLRRTDWELIGVVPGNHDRGMQAAAAC